MICLCGEEKKSAANPEDKKTEEKDSLEFYENWTISGADRLEKKEGSESVRK
jgi:hypothetical protein